MLSAAIAIDNHAEVSALSGWPDTYSAGVVDCLVALRMERRVDEARRLKEAG